ncbi:transposase [Methylomicrobium sp. RS1]|uniref:transposase n=1 Tax=Candidatus Methylomicrobium oryzae TaxID=2802053 RepID=UPI00192274F2|nr:transposase [Methylomicrobium sp. RS1]
MKTIKNTPLSSSLHPQLSSIAPKKLEPYWDLLEEKGMRFYFLPPYSPELNRIELLWHKMKYEWLKFKLYTPDELERAIDEIGEGFGDLYKLTFC